MKCFHKINHNVEPLFWEWGKSIKTAFGPVQFNKKHTMFLFSLLHILWWKHSRPEVKWPMTGHNQEPGKSACVWLLTNLLSFFSGGDFMSQPVQTTSPALMLTAECVSSSLLLLLASAASASTAIAEKLRAVRSCISCALVFSLGSYSKRRKSKIDHTDRARERGTEWGRRGWDRQTKREKEEEGVYFLKGTTKVMELCCPVEEWKRRNISDNDARRVCAVEIFHYANLCWLCFGSILLLGLQIRVCLVSNIIFPINGNQKWL